MTRPIPEPLLSRFSEFVASRLGLNFPQQRWRDLGKAVGSVAANFGQTSVESCIERLLSAPLSKPQLEILAGALTVGETYFFRDKRSFEVLSERVLPELFRSRNGEKATLRIWSAGCSTGEEPYSIAIALERFFGGDPPCPVTILATDINPLSLQKGLEGIFGDWSFRDAPAWLKQDYFEQVGPHRFEILPRIKEKVAFSYLNLAEDTYPSLTNNTNAMDLIFCRNVLMYFTPGMAKRVIGNFQQALVDRGWLTVSVVEASAELFSRFETERPEGTVLYRKSGSPRIPHDMPAPMEPESFRAAPVPFNSLAPAESRAAAAFTSEPASLRPTQVEAGEQGLDLSEQRNDAKAVQKLKESNDQSESVEASATRARACANSGDLLEARHWAEKAIAQQKMEPAVHYLHAIIVQELGAWDEAATSLRRAIYLDPNFVLGHFALGNQMLRRGKPSQADKHFKNTLALLAGCPADAVIPHSDGLLAGRLREWIESTRLSRKAK